LRGAWEQSWIFILNFKDNSQITNWKMEFNFPSPMDNLPHLNAINMTSHKLVKFSSVIHISTSTRTHDPLAAGIERFVGLEHIEPENLHIRS